MQLRSPPAATKKKKKKFGLDGMKQRKEKKEGRRNTGIRESISVLKT